MASSTVTGALFFWALFIWPGITPVEAGNYRQVVHVIDGDTVVLDGGERVRMIGINSPEQETKQRSAEPYAMEAKLALEDLVKGSKVKVDYDHERLDRYGRTLAYLELADGTDVQDELISQGYAAAVAVPPNLARVREYFSTESKARKRKAGIWDQHPWLVEINNIAKYPIIGFRLVTGKITNFKETGNNIVFIMSDRFSLLLSLKMWKTYWAGQFPGDFVGRRVEARGWAIENEKYNWISVRHPLMMTVH